jgi:nucleoside-diphosphate-sugar epimerase
MRNILITGGTGFVGQWMKQQAPKHTLNDDNIVYLSHLDYDKMEWTRTKWDFIVHLANIDPNVVLDIATRDKSRFLYCSSGAVYLDNLSLYGNNKVLWETDTIVSGVDCSIARLFTFCGAHLKGKNYAILNFIKNAVDCDPIRIIGNGKTIRTYMYGSDLGDWMWTILFKGQNGTSYDVGSSKKVTMLELAKEVSSNFEPEPRIDIVNSLLVEAAPSYVPTHVSVTEKELGVRVNVTLELAIREAVKDYKNGKN